MKDVPVAIGNIKELKVNWVLELIILVIHLKTWKKRNFHENT